MEIAVTVTGPGDVDELTSLWDWLRDEPEFRGQLRLTQAPPRPGAMGGALGDVLTVAVGPGAAATVLASALLTWIRSRTAAARLRLRWPDGAEIEFSAGRVASMDATEFSHQVDRLVAALEARGAAPGGADARSDGGDDQPDRQHEP